MRFSGRTWAFAGVGFLALAGAVVMTIGEDEKPAEETFVEPQQRHREARIAVDRTEPGQLKEQGRYGPDLDPEKARALLEKDWNDEKNIANRAQNAADIIAQLCRNGFTREAWELIDVNEGLVREKSLTGFFADANLPQEELVGMMDGLQTQERAMSLLGYWSRFSAAEFSVMDLSPFEIRSGNEQGVFRKTIENLLGEIHSADSDPTESAGLRKNLLTQLAKMMNDGSMAYWHLGELVRKDPSKDGFTYWEIAKTVNEQTRSQQDSYSGTDSQIVGTIAIQDAEKFMSMAMVNDSPEALKMHIAMEQWLLTDYDKAASWYESNKGSFDMALRDRAVAGFMRASAKRRNFDEALSWYAAFEADTWKKGMKREMQAIQRQVANK